MENPYRNRAHRLFIVALVLFGFVSGGCSSGGDDARPNDEGEDSLIQNSGFEDDEPTQVPSGWNTDTGNDLDADFTEGGGFSGKYALVHRKTSAYKVFTYQKVSDLENGYYSLTAWVKNSGGQNACYIMGEGSQGEAKMTSLPVASNWTKVIVRGIHVTDGTATVGLLSDANPNNWCAVDDLVMKKDDIPYSFLKGGDISELTYIEKKGGKFFENGVEKDAMAILADNGFNLARLRLYNDPGNPDFEPSKRLPAGIQDPSDILALAKRAKNHQMQILLTFHYSDYWSNGATQIKPHDWTSLNFEELKESVYQFTFDFMKAMEAQGTTPEFVSIGNEIQAGILYPDGAVANFDKLAELLKKGAEAVKAASSDTQVVLHLDDAGNKEKYDWFFGECAKYGVPYDVIGASYYPFWTGKKVNEITEWANYQSAKLGKPILIMETGYNWNPVAADGYPGQLSHNGPYDDTYPSSPEGQKNFMLECYNGLKLVDGGNVIGDLYWDPVMIAVPGVGWELGARNVVSNTTLFDFSGNALPVLKAFKYNN
jgi:arabinogalactan endo-1,4-beta-galactosidase